MRKCLTILSALLLLLPSCMHEAGSDASGYLKVDLREDFSSETVVTKADGGDPVFSLEVKSLRTGKEITVADASTLAAEPLTLAVGRYSLTASSGEVQNAAFDAPVYEGSQEVQIKPDQTVTASIICSLANTMVSVEFPAETSRMFSEYSVSVDNGSGAALVFSGADLERIGYFAVTGKLNWSVRMKNTDGLVYQAGPIVIDNVKAKQHYKLQYEYGKDNLTNGAGVFSVILDESTNVLTYPLVLDFSDSDVPVITSDFDITNEITVPAGSTASMNLFVSSASGLKSLVLTQNNAELTAKGVSSATELVDASAETVATLKAAGIVAASVAFGAQEATVSLTDMFSGLGIGPVPMNLVAIDTRNHYAEVPLNFEIISPVDAEAVSATPWAQFAILKARWFTSDRPSGLGFQYRKATASTWYATTGAISYNASAKTFTTELYGLEPETEYVFRAISTKDKETKEIHFTTESAGTVDNLSFDNWYKDGSCWYPNAEGAIKVWDSANPGTSGLGVVPTVPEDSDVAVSGSGKRAARLESMKVTVVVITKFAAGNIYTGSFDKVSGVGAELDWGIPFTSRPLALQGYYKYQPKAIDMAESPYTGKKGEMDNCSIKIYLVDWEHQFHINTAKQVFFSDDDPSIIGMGDFTTNETSNGYIRFTLPIQYRTLDKKPTHIVIVGAASRLGDYFTGGVGSRLYLDEFSLLYDPASLTEDERELVGYRK